MSEKVRSEGLKDDKKVSPVSGWWGVPTIK